MLVIVLLLAAWLVVTNARQRRLQRRFNAILEGVEEGNVPAMLAEYLSVVRKVANRTDEMEGQVDYLIQNLPYLVRHVGLVRFSPFHDTGGDQSFSMAILDGRGDGIVVSALHSRQESKLYAKPVNGGKSRYSLTEEEKQAIDESVQTQQPQQKSERP
jgi:hypothetical protein